MPSVTRPSHLVNRLASAAQLETSASALEGMPPSLVDAVRYESCRLVQAAGIVLRLPQELAAQAIVILCRFWTGAQGGSMLEHDATDAAAAALYIAAKPSGHSLHPRQLLTVFTHLAAISPVYEDAIEAQDRARATKWFLTDGTFESGRERLYATESHILRVLGFDPHVALPYTICINYLQTLEVFGSSYGAAVAKRAFGHLNTALLSPQLLYLTHQPSALATAAIYLASREVGVKLPEVEWWEVFDVDREELGFLVVAMQSIHGFAAEQRRLWKDRNVPLTVKGMEEELQPLSTADE